MHMLKCWELSITLNPCECSPNRAPFLKLGQDNPQISTDVLTQSLGKGQRNSQMFSLTSSDLATTLKPWLRPVIVNSPLNKPILIGEEQPLSFPPCFYGLLL